MLMHLKIGLFHGKSYAAVLFSTCILPNYLIIDQPRPRPSDRGKAQMPSLDEYYARYHRSQHCKFQAEDYVGYWHKNHGMQNKCFMYARGTVEEYSKIATS